MPIYNYRCEKCQFEFEEIRTIANRRWTDPCPKCGIENTIDLILTASPKIVSSVGTPHSKTDSGFRDNLKRIKKFWKRSTINI